MIEVIESLAANTARHQFRKKGYLFLPGFLSQQEITAVKEHLQNFLEDHLKDMPQDMVFYEDKADKRSLKQLQRLFDFSTFFQHLMFGSKFEQLAELLLEAKVVGKNLQYFNKPPKIGRATPAHQDGYYFKIDPIEALTMWLPLDLVNEDNGCVRYVSGSHVWGLRPHGRTDVLGFSQGIIDFGSTGDRANEICVPAKPGDLLIHHALTIHRADRNITNSSARRALGFVITDLMSAKICLPFPPMRNN